MHGPLRSEVDVFRWVVVVVVGVASVSALTLLSPVVGLIWAVMLLGFGAGLAWRSSRGSPLRQTELSRGEDDKHRVLVIANQTVVGSRALLAEIKNRCGGQRGEILIVTPAQTGSRAAHWASDDDAAIEEARQRLELSLQAIEEPGLHVRGQVGDSDPNIALEDALRVFAADEIIISTHPPDRSPWLEHGVVQRARQEFDLPVTHIVVDLENEAANRAEQA